MVFSALVFLNAGNSYAQGSGTDKYYYKEDFGTATPGSYSTITKTSTTNNENVQSHFRRAGLSDILPDNLLFYNSEIALVGQTKNWGPIYTSSGLRNIGSYSVVTNSRGYNQEFFYSGLDHTEGDGNLGYMLLVDAHNNTNLYFDRVLTQGDGLVPGRGYRFSIWIKNVNNEVNQNPLKVPPRVRISIYDADKYPSGPNAYNSPTGRLAYFEGGPPENSSTSGAPQWHQVFLEIPQLDAGVTRVRLQIVNTQPNELGNDLAIDDIEFYSLEVQANDDVYGPYGSSVGGLTGTVLLNDKFNGESFTDDVPTDIDGLPVTLYPGTSPLPGKITMNENGTITVAPGTPPGTYYYPYSICVKEAGFENICDPATATITVICDDKTFIAGRVYDERDDSPLAFVPVSLIPQFSPADTLRLYTNIRGEYRFAGVPEGAYIVQVQDAILIAQKSLLPVNSSLFITTLVNCEPQVHDYPYNLSPIPVIGDFVWLDANGDGLQNEWYDANGDNKITKNDFDLSNPDAFPTLDYSQWEWVDINGDNSWEGPENEGELNRAGLGHGQSRNIKISGPEGYTNEVVVGVDGIWRDRPYIGEWLPENAVFGDFTAVLEPDANFESVAIRMAETGKVKTYDAAGNAVLPGSGARRSFGREADSRNARVAALVITAPNGLQNSGSVSESSLVDNTLDIGLNVVEQTLPVSLAYFNAAWSAEEKAVRLDWTTTSESGSKGFDVEHSTDAAAWTPIGFVASEASDRNDPVSYTFRHTTPSAGINYYRLKQLDLNGTFENSVMRSVVVEGNGVTGVYPNPAADLLNITAAGRYGGVREMNLVDALGRSVRHFGRFEPVVSLSGLASGVYHLNIVYLDGSFENVKVLKK